MKSVAIAMAAAAGLLGCGAAPHTRAAGAVSALAVKPVTWNPTSARIGRVRAVADAGAVVAVLADDGAMVLSAGAVVAKDTAVTDWVSAATIAGADGSARWIVGIDGRGHLYYLHGASAFEDVSARYGLDGTRVRSAAMLDAGHVAFLLDGEIAIADGRRVTRYGRAPWALLAGGAGWGAAVSPDALTLFDAARLATRAYSIPGVVRAAVGAGGRVFAATSRAIYASTKSGDLALVYDAEGDSIHGLVASGDHVWFADGGELGMIEPDRVSESSGAKIAPDASLVASPGGDVWVLAGGSLQRFGRAEPERALGITWSATLAPICARSCASCHLPGGPSGTDLSNAEAWESERAAIRTRVVEARTMPPEGHALSDADRDVIAAWVAGGTRP